MVMCPSCKRENSLVPYSGLLYGAYTCKQCGFVGNASGEKLKDKRK